MNRVWLLACLLMAPWFTQAQPLITITAGNATACVGDTVSIPVNATGGSVVSAISLALNYQTQSLGFVGVNNVQPALAGNLIVNAAGGKVLASWFSTQSITLTAGTLFNIRMVIQGNMSPLEWDLLTPGNCEIANASGTPIPTDFINGNVAVNGSMVFGQSQIAVGGSTQFNASATGAASYQWQNQVGGQWVSLQNDATFQGVQTPVLSITNAPASLNGILFRVVSTGLCPGTVFSNPITLSLSFPPQGGVSLPITWDDNLITYTFTDFGGNTSVLAPSPTQSSNVTLRTEKTIGAQTWAGTTITPPAGLTSPIPFASGSTSISVLVHAPAAGVVVRLKAEQTGSPNISVETEAITTTSGWQTLVFNFANQAAGTAPINFANTYNMLSIFYGFGSAGTGTVFFADSVFFGGGPVVPPAAAFNLPITWDNPQITYTFTDFGGNASALAPSPTQPGNTTLRTEKTIGAQTWAGTTITPTSGLSTPIPFATGATSVLVQVHAPAPGIVVRLKAEQAGFPNISVETEATTTTAGWQTLAFDFANQAAGTAPINFANTYNLLSIFYGFGSAGTGAVFFADSVFFNGGPVGPPPVVFNLPITWDDAALPYTVTDFGGNSSALAPSPTQPGNTTLRTEKTLGAQTWAGTTITPPAGLSSPLPFASGSTSISVQVHAPAPGIVVRLKAEQTGNPSISVETEATTSNGGWQTLVFNFANQAAGTAPLNFGATYNMLSIFYDFGNAGTGAVFFADSVFFGGAPVGPPPVVFNLPITWDNPTIQYIFTDFGGTSSSLAPSPTQTGNTTLRTEKVVGAEFWAGTTITPPTGLSTAIPFAPGSTQISVQVYAPAPGIVVRLKAEQVGAPALSVETEATTTAAGWQTLSFDFANQVVNTPTLNFSTTYNLLSIFYGFGSVGTGAVFFADSVYFGTAPVGPPPSSVQISLSQQTACFGDTLYVPVMHNGLNGLAALSLSLNYPMQAIEFVGVGQVIPALTQDLIVNASNGQVRASWFNVNPLNLTNGSLFEMAFVVRDDAILAWDLATPGNCELADVNGNIIATQFIGGSIDKIGQVIVDQPFGDNQVDEGDTTVFIVDASGATAYQWQAFIGQQWINLQNDTVFGGVQSPTLSLQNVPFSLNNIGFRVLVFGPCPQVVISDPLILSVQGGPPPPHQVNLIPSRACLGDTLIVQVQVNKFQNIGAISMVLEHPANLSFVNVRSVNPALNPANLVITPRNGSLAFAWFDNQSLSLNDGATLFTLRYVVNGSGTIAWDTQTPGNCEIANSNGVVVPGTFNNLAYQPNPAPVVQFQPASQLVANNDTARFSVTAQHVQAYQWQRLVNGSWVNLNENASFVGTQTATLSVIASQSLSGSVFRVRLMGLCAGPSFSQQANLTVAATNQVIGITAPQLTACLNQTISLPIQATNFNGVSAFSLSLNYDTTLLQFAGFTANSAIQNGLVVNGNFNGAVRLSWFNVSPVNLGTANLISLQFNTRLLGQSQLVWTSNIQGVNDIADVNGQPILTNFVNGAVLTNGTSPVITQQPQGQTVAETNTASFTVAATNANQFQWQTLSGTQWVNLQNVAPYSGVTTATLAVANTTLAMNGTQFRVLVSGNCLPGTTSQPVLLTVTPNVSTISVRLGNDSLCAGGTVSMPVRVSQFNQIGSFSLRILYNQANLQYTGLSNVHSAIQATLASGAANGRLSLSWFGFQPLSLADTVLFNINFRANGSSSLIWDTVSAGVGVIANTQGNALPRQFVNGNIQARPLPVIQFSSFGNLCLNGSAIQLQASPAGGQFSGTGVTGGQFNPATAGLGTHVITYTYTDPITGCSNAATQSVTVVPLPLGSAGADQTICLGTSTALQANGGASYLWSTGATTATISVAPLVTTAYTVRITNAGGCSITDTVVVNIFNDPSLQANADTSVCLGGSVQLQASGGLQYFWTPSTGLSATNIANPIASPTVTTDYIVAGLTSSGCVSLDTVRVTVNPRPQANAGSDQIVCNGNGAQLQASGGVSYSWSPSTGLSATNIPNPVATPTQTTDYIVTVTNASGCTATDTVRVFVPTILAGSNRNICRGGNVQLQATLIGAPTGNVSYSWSPSGGLSATNIANPVASPSVTTIYTVTATIGNCSVSNTVAVIVNPTPFIDAGLDVSIAPGANIQLNAVATGGLTPYTIQWTPSAGLSNAQVLNPTASPAATTRYYLSVSGANGCAVIDSVLITVDPALLGKNIFGKLVYASSSQPPISPGSVELRNNQGVLLSTTAVDGNANFLFQNNADATYQLVGTTSKSWGGVSSADALIINQAFVDPAVITTGALGLKAADVNNDGVVNAIDAQQTLSRVVGSVSSFVAGDWVYATDTVVLAGAHVQRNVRAICVGDVNASYDPSLRIMPRVVMAEGSRMGRPASGVEQIQLLMDEAISLGSYQLEIQLQPGDKLVSVHQPQAVMQPIFAQQGNVVRIAWFAPAVAQQLRTGDLFLQLQIATQGFGEKGLPFELIGMSEMTNLSAEVYPQVRLRTPVWMPSSTTANLNLKAYPNPARDYSRIAFSIPVDGQVKISLTDMAGRIIEVPLHQYQVAGQYELQLEAGSLSAGMYFIRLEHESNGSIQRLQERLIIQK